MSVNMVSGNLALTAGTHGVSALAGAVDLSLAYNSADAEPWGLLGQYYEDADRDGAFDPSDPLVHQRVDRVLNFDWGYGPPVAGLTGLEHYLARWSGYVRFPEAGTWRMGSISAAGMRVWVTNSAGAEVVQRRRVRPRMRVGTPT